jgi:hypothetical protein
MSTLRNNHINVEVPAILPIGKEKDIMKTGICMVELTDALKLTTLKL